MDSGTRSGRQRKHLTVTPPAQENKTFTKLESQFLSLLPIDVEAAGKLIPRFRKGRINLNEVESARRDWLIGRYYEACSRHDQALVWMKKARKAFEALNDREGIYLCLLTLFSAYMHVGRYDKARECAREAFEGIARTDAEKLKMHINLGNLENRMHRYQEAIQEFKAALDLLNNDPRLEGIILYNMGNALGYLNRFSEAETNYQRAIELFTEQNATLYRAHVLQQLSLLNVTLGQFFHAETQLKQARTLYLKGGDEAGAAWCDLYQFRLNVSLNKFDDVLNEVDPLINTFRRLALPYETGLILYHAAHAAIGQGDDALADVFLEEATSSFKDCKNLYYLALCSMLQGILSWKEGDKNSAALLLNSARKVFWEQRLKELELECLVDLCRVEDRHPSKTEYARMRRLLSAPIGHQVRVRTLILVSDYWRRKGQLKKAIETRFEAVMIIEESRASIQSEDMRESFFGDKAQAYDSLIEWLFEWKDPKASQLIFRLLGLSRGRRFAESLSQTEALPPVVNRNEPTMLAINKLHTRLGQLNRKLRHLSDDPLAPEAEKAAILHAYEEARNDWKNLRLQMRDEERLGIYFPIDITPEEISGRLMDDCLVISYFIGATRIYRVEFDKHRLHTVSKPLYHGFHKDINLLTTILSNRLLGKRARIEKITDRLQKLLAPDSLTNHQRLIIIPHKSLQGFPFAVLKKGAHYIIENHSITVCPNLAALYFSLNKPKPKLLNPVFFFSQSGNDPRAPERHFMIGRFPQAPIYTKITSDSIEEAAKKSDFMHFAGHCHFDKQDPASSFFEMGGEKVLLGQLKHQHLNCPFINLASCQSGVLALKDGNEIYGFVTSFIAMGAVNVMASLWDIDDEATGDWMVIFYKNLGLGLAEAYRVACLEIMKKRPDPYFWAGFCLSGKP